MTSRALFYKGMIEDLRHRIWMIALSCLGSFMAMPVFFLLMRQEWDDRVEHWTEFSSWSIDEYKLEAVRGFFCEYLTITCGIVLVAGALIVGIFGFRFVFSKKMVDLYHSIPITRKQLFLVHYIDGFLIWFVPMLVGAVICMIFAAFFLSNGAAWLSAAGSLMITIGNLVVAFLLIYHLAIVAVMLSGNIINTIISGTIIGFVILAFYGMIEAFASAYFSTYYSFFGENLPNVIWASPIPGAIYQLYMRTAQDIQAVPFVMNLFMIVLMWIAGFVIYHRRPSELAEQGIKIKSVKVVFKTLVTCLAGMVGWILFYFITGEESIGWMIFGTVLAAVLVYGILDIIFHMDFKAFFAHKLQMTVTVVASILIGFVFMFDWIGYDSYLPDKDDIVNMGVYMNRFGFSRSDYSYGDNNNTTTDRINNMEYTDRDVIYAFLEEMAGKETKYPINGESTTAYVRVTEKSGKTYYRMYRVWEEDEELVAPILRDESYIRTNVLVPQSLIDHVEIDEKYGAHAEFESLTAHWVVDKTEAAREFLTAYNQDLLDNPDLYIYQQDEVLASAFFRGHDDYYYYLHLDIYESMERVKAVLEKYGYDSVLDKPTAKDIEFIQFLIYGGKEAENLKVYFGLEEASLENTEKDKEALVLNPNSAEKTIVYTEEAVLKQTVAAEELEYYYEAVFTKQSDINALMKVISLETPYMNSMFGPDYCSCDIHLKLKNGENHYVQIKKGVMPERFLDDFVLTSQE